MVSQETPPANGTAGFHVSTDHARLAERALEQGWAIGRVGGVLLTAVDDELMRPPTEPTPTLQRVSDGKRVRFYCAELGRRGT